MMVHELEKYMSKFKVNNTKIVLNNYMIVFIATIYKVFFPKIYSKTFKVYSLNASFDTSNSLN